MSPAKATRVWQDGFDLMVILESLPETGPNRRADALRSLRQSRWFRRLILKHFRPTRLFQYMKHTRTLRHTLDQVFDTIQRAKRRALEN